jgi:hypothetical protein
LPTAVCSRVLRRSQTAGADDCIVTLITNVSVDFDTNKIFKKLANRTRVGWSLSFDNIDQRFEYVRHGGTWDLLEKNLDILKPLMASGAHWGGIHAVYNIYNATCLVELTKFVRDRGLAIHWQSLYQPDCLDPARLGKEIAELATKEIENLLALDICLLSEQQFFENVLQNQTHKDDLRIQLSNHIEEIETQYHRDQHGKFKELWPEIYNIL